jgi:hypothetical protein
MNITHYLVDFGYSTALKNNLQKEAFEYLKSFHGKLIERTQVPELMKVIISEIIHLNAKHSRCKPLQVLLQPGHPKTDIVLFGFPEVSFKLKAAELCHVSQFQRVVSPSNN